MHVHRKLRAALDAQSHRFRARRRLFHEFGSAIRAVLPVHLKLFVLQFIVVNTRARIRLHQLSLNCGQVSADSRHLNTVRSNPTAQSPQCARRS